MNAEDFRKKFTTDPSTPPLFYGPLALGQILWVALYGTLSPAAIAALWAAGLFSWTLIEYLLHRFSFHFVTDNGFLRAITASGLHWAHHGIPNAPEYVIAPMIVSVPLYGFFFGLFYLLGGSLEVAALMGSGLVVGYLFYEWVHFATHQRPAKTRIGKFLKKYHMLHHFKDSDHYFGVTSPLWDVVFRTKPDYETQTEARILPIYSRLRIVPSDAKENSTLSMLKKIFPEGYTSLIRQAR